MRGILRARVAQRDERGAVALFAALIAFVLIVVAAIAVDIGMQRVARSDMQTLADVVALDLSRELDGRTVAELTAGTPSVIQTLANESRDRNKGTLGDTPIVTPTLGTISAAGAFTPMTSGVPTAVKVIASTSVDFAFGILASGGATRPAVATSSAGACYRVSSFALGLATKDSVLRALLGSAASLRVLSNAGLATASVSLLGIAAKLGAGTPQELVDLPNLTVGGFLDAAASVLNDKGDTASADLATQLLGLKTDIGPVLANATVPLSQLLDVGQGGASAVDAGINVLDVVTGSAQVANGQNAINVPEFGVGLGLANVRASLYLTSPAKQACNGGVATSSQGYIKITGSIGICSLIALCTDVTLTVNLANASAKQSPNWTCSTDNLTLSVFDQTLASIRLQAEVYLNVIITGKVSVAKVDTGSPGSGPAKDYDLPLPDAYSEPGVETSSGTVGLSLADADITLLGVLTTKFLVRALLAPLLASVTDVLVPNLADGLGLTVDGADLTAVPTVSCTSPRLVG